MVRKSKNSWRYSYSRVTWSWVVSQDIVKVASIGIPIAAIGSNPSPSAKTCIQNSYNYIESITNLNNVLTQQILGHGCKEMGITCSYLADS